MKIPLGVQKLVESSTGSGGVILYKRKKIRELYDSYAVINKMIAAEKENKKVIENITFLILMFALALVPSMMKE